MKINIKMYLKRFIRRFRYCFIWRNVEKRNQKQSCDRCGRFIWIDFVVSDECWKRIIGDFNKCLCLDCFLEIVNNKGASLLYKDFRLLLATEIQDLYCIFLLKGRPTQQSKQWKKRFKQ